MKNNGEKVKESKKTPRCALYHTARAIRSFVIRIYRTRYKYALLLIFATPLFLCSFTSINNENGNNYLHKSDISSILPHLSLGSEGENDGDVDKFNDSLDELISKIPDDLIGYFTGDGDIDGVLSSIFIGIKESGVFAAVLTMIASAVLFGLAETESGLLGGTGSMLSSSVAAVISLPALTFAGGIINAVCDGIDAASGIFSLAIPAVTSLAAIGTLGSSAAVGASGMGLSLGLVSGLLLENLAPLSALLFSLALLSSFDTGGYINALSRGIRSSFNTLVGIVSVAVSGFLASGVLIAAAKDGAVLRGARFAISGMVPIMGGTLSGALSAIVSGVRLTSGALGAVTASCIVYSLAVPIALLLIYRLALGVAASLSAYFGASLGERFFTAERGAVDCLIAAAAATLIVYTLEISLLIGTIRGIV